MDEKELIRLAIEAKTLALAPYSNFRVGAALLAESGKVYCGGNIESSSYGLTVCAERVALFKALSEGEREFQAIAVAADTESFCRPCGACRQVLWDYASTIDVIMIDGGGASHKTTLKDLLPEAFDKQFLGGKR